MIGGGSGGVVVENCCHLLWGRCGLKSEFIWSPAPTYPSPSVRKVWIEINIFTPALHPDARKVWIEIYDTMADFLREYGHLLWGRCGLKFTITAFSDRLSLSPSVRKVWIEIKADVAYFAKGWRHLLWGRCGLKFFVLRHSVDVQGHLLWGRCGLKFH